MLISLSPVSFPASAEYNPLLAIFAWKFELPCLEKCVLSSPPLLLSFQGLHLRIPAGARRIHGLPHVQLPVKFVVLDYPELLKLELCSSLPQSKRKCLSLCVVGPRLLSNGSQLYSKMRKINVLLAAEATLKLQIEFPVVLKQLEDDRKVGPEYSTLLGP